MNHWHTIITFDQPLEAHMAKNLLESEGILTIMRDELTVQSHNFYSNAIGGIKLDVREECIDEALNVLVDGGYLQPPEEEEEKKRLIVVSKENTKDTTLCPFCQSKEIRQEGNQRQMIMFVLFLFGLLIPLSFVMGSITMGVVTTVVAAVILIYMFKRKSYSCFDCGGRWRYRS
ncbi:DUF2007 domain-containing protein [Prolixibacteraceae bacterium]|nr:DUF2007 domain-containing protein [Prolixibacteraceae bacterium]